MRRNLFSAARSPVAVQRGGRFPSRQRFTFRATRWTVDKHDSMGLVVASFRRNTMNLATLHFHLFAKNLLYTGSQRFRSVNHHQIPPLPIQAAVHQIFQQPLDHRGVLRGSLPHPQNVLLPAFCHAQGDYQHLAAEVNPIDHQHYQIQILQPSFA
jgi:hypothetical protein